jgi:hypothetical protein
MNRRQFALRLLAAGLIAVMGCPKSNRAPVIPPAPTGPNVCAVGMSYEFTATTTDPDGDSVAFQFAGSDTSDWSEFVAGGDSVTVSKSWDVVGNRSVVARAKDSKGNVSGWSSALAVLVRTNEAPAAPDVPSGPSSGLVGVSYRFTTTTTDPDADAVQFRYSWGDGDTSNWGEPVESGQADSAAHTWNAAGFHPVMVQARDKLGAISGWSEAAGIMITSTAYPYTIALTWGQDPRDLDSHIWTPEVEGSTYHVYYGSTGSLATAPYCSLDVDDVTSYGPEHTTIATAFTGEYTYAVHHYSGDSTITNSHARVELYVNGVLSRTFNVPQEPAEGRRWWHVFKLDGSTGAVTELNVISSSPPVPTAGLPRK